MQVLAINIFTICILVVICIFFIVHKIDDKLLEEWNKYKSLYENEYSRNDTLLKIIKEIQKELKFTQLKECPQEELKDIPKEIIEWIDILFKGVDDQNNGKT